MDKQYAEKCEQDYINIPNLWNCVADTSLYMKSLFFVQLYFVNKMKKIMLLILFS